MHPAHRAGRGHPGLRHAGRHGPLLRPLRLCLRSMAHRLDHHHGGIPLQDHRQDRPVQHHPRIGHLHHGRPAPADAAGRFFVWCLPGGRRRLWRAGGHHRLAAGGPGLQPALCRRPVPHRQYCPGGLRRHGHPHPGGRQGFRTGSLSHRSGGRSPAAHPLHHRALLAGGHDGRHARHPPDLARRAGGRRLVCRHPVPHRQLHRPRTARCHLRAGQPGLPVAVPEEMAARGDLHLRRHEEAHEASRGRVHHGPDPEGLVAVRHPHRLRQSLDAEGPAERARRSHHQDPVARPAQSGHEGCPDRGRAHGLRRRIQAEPARRRRHLHSAGRPHLGRPAAHAHPQRHQDLLRDAARTAPVHPLHRSGAGLCLRGQLLGPVVHAGPGAGRDRCGLPVLLALPGLDRRLPHRLRHLGQRPVRFAAGQHGTPDRRHA